MSTHKYADLPDIVCIFTLFTDPVFIFFFQDTAPDVYETEDVFPSTHSIVSFFHTVGIEEVHPIIPERRRERRRSCSDIASGAN